MSGNRDITSYIQKFIPRDNYLSFNYLAVLDSDHSDAVDAQPFFKARLLDTDDNIIQGANLCISANPNDPLISNQQETVFYTSDWYCGMLYIPDQYLNTEIKVQFLITVVHGMHTEGSYTWIIS